MSCENVQTNVSVDWTIITTLNKLESSYYKQDRQPAGVVVQDERIPVSDACKSPPRHHAKRRGRGDVYYYETTGLARRSCGASCWSNSICCSDERRADAPTPPSSPVRDAAADPTDPDVFLRRGNPAATSRRTHRWMRAGQPRTPARHQLLCAVISSNGDLWVAFARFNAGTADVRSAAGRSALLPPRALPRPTPQRQRRYAPRCRRAQRLGRLGAAAKPDRRRLPAHGPGRGLRARGGTAGAARSRADTSGTARTTGYSHR